MTAMPEIPAKDSAKIIRTIGFALFLFSTFLVPLQFVVYSIPLPAFFYSIFKSIGSFNDIVCLLQFSGLFLAAVGFFITFSSRKEDKPSLFAGITLALAAVLSILRTPPILYQFLLYLFVIALAVRTLRYNRKIGILLIVAFVYQFAAKAILWIAILNAILNSIVISTTDFGIILLFAALADIFCAVMALLSCVLEKTATMSPAVRAIDNAKILRTVGFTLFLFSDLLNFLSMLRPTPDYPAGSWFWALSMLSFPYANIIRFFQFAGLLLAAVGFFVTFSKNKADKSALFAGITLALTTVLSVLPHFPPLFNLFFINLFLIALAVRTLRYNRTIGVLLIVAFAYQILSPVIISIISTLDRSFTFTYPLYYLIALLIAFGDIFCALMALLSVVLEKDKGSAKSNNPYMF